MIYSFHVYGMKMFIEAKKNEKFEKVVGEVLDYIQDKNFDIILKINNIYLEITKDTTKESIFQEYYLLTKIEEY